jgi:hypothetical protein
LEANLEKELDSPSMASGRWSIIKRQTQEECADRS